MTGRPAFPVRHLFGRFLQVARPVPLTPAEQGIVADRLRPFPPEVADLFWRQVPADQRHAFEVMRRCGLWTTSTEVAVAALLHDVGKAPVRLGPIGRSLATVLDVAGMPMTPVMAAYRRHGPIGAEMLAAAGAPPLAVDFARRHPDPDPGDADADRWAALLAADDL